MFSEAFVSAVGKMPFTGRHSIRHFYTEGTRATRRGDSEGRSFYIKRIGQFAASNAIMGAAGLFMSGLCIRYGIAGNTWQFAPDTIVAGAYGVGHTVSAIAECIIQKRLQDRPFVEALEPVTYVEPPPSPPTLWERVVTNGGTALFLAPILHMTIYEAAQQFNR